MPCTRKYACAVMLALLIGCEAATVAVSDDAGIDAATDARTRADAAVTGASSCEPKVIPNAPVPAPYAGLKSPLPPSADVVAAGKAKFAQRCVLCHGSSGQGDGREGPFDPPAADLTSKVRADDYLYWRISEGGGVEPFCTAMPAFARLFADEARWELVAYVRSLAAADAATVADAMGD